MNTAALRAGAENLGRWALRRAQERSTWVGITMLLAALGHATLSAQVAKIDSKFNDLAAAGSAALAKAATAEVTKLAA